MRVWRLIKAIGWGLVALACPGAFGGSGALHGKKAE
jgi:hypothetical protein